MRWNRHPSRTGVLLVLSLLLAGGLQALAQPATPAKPAAEVNGQPITEEEIDKAIAGPLAKLQEQIYTLRQQRLEAAIRNRLLAQEAERRGLSVSKLLDTEVMSKVGVVTEEEVEGFYQANKARIGNANEAEIRDRIRSGLQGQKIAVQREAFVQSLRKSATVTINLQPPPVTRVEVPIDGAPAKGRTYTSHVPVSFDT